MEVAEIAVRFGDTTLDVAHVSSGTYRIGTAADVDLALHGLTSFPLIDWSARGCMLRIPAGVTVRIARICDGTPLSGSMLLRRGDEIELAIDRLAIRVSLIARADALPRPRFDLRWSAWVAGALVVHLFALGLAHALATPDLEGVNVPTIASLIPRPPEPENPAIPVRVVRKRDAQQRRAAVQAVAVVEPSVAEPHAQSEPARRGRAVESARRAGILGSARLEDAVKAVVGKVDLGKALSEVGPIYREHEAEAKRFGGGRSWDPSKDRRFDSIATGRYATVANGRAAGEYYRLPGEVGGYVPPRLEHCTGACSATGGMSKDTVQTVLARHSQTMLDCYDRYGRKKPGAVTLEFEVRPDGKVAHAHGDGLGGTGGCVAAVVRRASFPAAPTTTATYSMSFAP